VYKKKNWLAKLFLFAVLGLGSMTGPVMTQQQVEDLMNLMHRTEVMETVKKEGE
jgi:hypothetical protein